MNPSQRDAWAPEQRASGTRGTDQSPRALAQPTPYGANPPAHQQQPPPPGAALPPPQGSYYHGQGPPPENPSNPSHENPSRLPPQGPHSAMTQHDPRNDPRWSDWAPPTREEVARREAEIAAEIREINKTRPVHERERPQDFPTQESHSEPVLQQPTPSRAAFHDPNGLLSMGQPGAGAPASGPPPAAALYNGGPGPQFERSEAGGPPAGAIYTPQQPGQRGGIHSISPNQQPILNVGAPPLFELFDTDRDYSLQDALSYLDQVKVQFANEASVYNQFLDIMKDFKSQAIDTPGVIRRVSQLFSGHPLLIQGFNTFLPPGYRIECSSDGDPSRIRVTTPMGTTVSTLGETLVPSSSHPAMNGPEAHAESEDRQEWQQTRRAEGGDAIFSPADRTQGLPGYGAGRGDSRLSPLPAGHLSNEPQSAVNAGLLARQQEQHGVAQLQADTAAANDAAIRLPGMSPLVDAGGPSGAMAAQTEKRGPVEFNHAISYVNKIKNRFASQPEIYKQFLEILQTYQRESKPIQEVYKQVTTLFDGAPDLLEDFKQFLPESAAQAKAQQQAREAAEMTQYSELRGSYNNAAHQQTPRVENRNGPPSGKFFPTPTNERTNKRKRPDRALDGPEFAASNHQRAGGPPPAKKVNRVAQHPADLEANYQMTRRAEAAVQPSLVPGEPEPMVPNESLAASSEELAFFEKVKKFVGNKSNMAEFLKVCNLYSQDIINRSRLVSQVSDFIGRNEELSTFFRNFVQYDSKDVIIENKARVLVGRVNLNNCRSLGQSYRQIPKKERYKPCSGRDELCNSVLNDDWVSHPTWASEDSGFIAHRKNSHEETLHRIEEERHDYDHHISNVDRVIQLLEPLNVTLRGMTLQERAAWSIPEDFANQCLPIYRKVLTKFYGRDYAKEILENTPRRPANIVPVILNRCQNVRESWKASQREWEKVWRDQTERAFWRSLDHQGVNVKFQDKRQFQAKTLQNEIQVKYEEQKRARLGGYRDVPRIQMEQLAGDKDVIIDASRLLLAYANKNFAADYPKLTPFVHEFIPLFFGLQINEFGDAVRKGVEDIAMDEDNNEEVELSESSGTSKTQSRGKKQENLRKNLLDKKAAKSKSDREDSDQSESRAASPKSNNGDFENPELDDDAESEAAGPRSWVDRLLHVKAFERKDTVLRPDEPFERQNFNLYANQNIYCFFRMFLILYERLWNLKNNEAAVHDTVKRAKSTKPAEDLKIIDRSPAHAFGDTSPDANYYQQMLNMLQGVVTQDGSCDMGHLEDVLRRYYLQNGWMLYTFDKLMSALVRFAIAVLGADSKDKSWNIIELFMKDRRKEMTTHAEELQYRKLSEKSIKEGDVYRITFNQQSKRATIRLLKREEATFEMPNEDEGLLTREQRWSHYISSFVNIDPTEGVQQSRLAPSTLRKNLRDLRKLIESKADADADDIEAAGELAMLTTIQHSEVLPIKIDPDAYLIYFGEKPYGDGNKGEEWWFAEQASETRDVPSGDKSGKPASTQGESDGQNAEGAHNGDRHDKNAIFDERFLMNSSWMREKTRDEVESKKKDLSDWKGDDVDMTGV